MCLNKEIFEFSESRVKTDVLYESKLRQKIEHSFKHLLTNKRIPINKLAEDNTFNFKKLKFSEGKNYDWFFLTNDTTTLLVRQYGQHFTFFSKTKVDNYFEKVNVFIIHFNREKITDDKLSDQFCDNPFLGLSDLLPSLIKLLVDNKVHSLWNNYSFIRPDYVDVKNVYNGGDDVSNMDDFLFACDELFQKYLECYAENEMLAKIKTLKPGDKFGKTYTVKKVQTNVKDGYYHDAGLKFSEGKEKQDWADVYSLTRYYYDALNYDDMVDAVRQFAYANYQTAFDTVSAKKTMGFIFVSNFIVELHKLFNETNKIEVVRFRNLLPKDFETFIEQLYIIKNKL